MYAYPAEHYPYWRRELPDADLPWGAFGENFTTDGLLEDEVWIGDRYRIGTAELVVTQPRMPCYKLGIRFGRADMVKRFLQSRRSGFYLAVAQEGEAGAGDAIERIARDSRRLTVADVVTLYATDSANQPLLENASNHPFAARRLAGVLPKAAVGARRVMRAVLLLAVFLCVRRGSVSPGIPLSAQSATIRTVTVAAARGPGRKARSRCSIPARSIPRRTPCQADTVGRHARSSSFIHVVFVEPRRARPMSDGDGTQAPANHSRDSPASSRGQMAGARARQERRQDARIQEIRSARPEGYRAGERASASDRATVRLAPASPRQALAAAGSCAGRNREICGIGLACLGGARR